MMSKQMNRPQTKQERRQERREEQRRREAERQRAAKIRRIVGISAAVVVVLGVIAVSSYFYFNYNKGTNTQSSNPTGNAVNNAAYPQVDNIICEANEQVAYHIHVHLSMYINGQPVPLPQGIGIAGDQSCLYWLHVHTTDGVIHIESPNQDKYTLGTFFRLWSQVFPQDDYPSQLDQTSGWKVYINGKIYNGDFHNIQFNAHDLITMGYNSPNIAPDTQYNWGSA